MSNIVTEGKKISGLPVSVDFSETAVVVIVDGGKTVQMPLKLLREKITESVNADVNNNTTALSTQVKTNTDNISAVVDTLNKNVQSDNEFKADIGAKIAALESRVNNGAYSMEIVRASSSEIRTGLLDTRDLVSGSALDYEALMDTTDETCIVLVKEVKRGDFIIPTGDGLIPSEMCPNIVVAETSEGGFIYEVASIESIRSAGMYTFKNSGYAFIPITNAKTDTQTVLYYYTPKTELPKVSEADNGKILQVAYGVWTAVDVASFEGSVL